MRYRVVFSRRLHSDGRESEINPVAMLDGEIPDGVVADKLFVERLETGAQHPQEVLDEDDAFLGASAPEIWEYDVVDERCRDFEDAARNSRVVMEFEVVDSTSTTEDEAGEVPLDEGNDFPREIVKSRRDPSEAGAGERAEDGGPVGEPTLDPSAEGMEPGRRFGRDQVNGIADEGQGDLDDLAVVSEDDPSLGLTDHRGTPPDDPAANTGPARGPGRGIETDDVADRTSTLGPGKRRRR